jgi:hypothetical protein
MLDAVPLSSNDDPSRSKLSVNLVLDCHRSATIRRGADAIGRQARK